MDEKNLPTVGLFQKKRKKCQVQAVDIATDQI